MTREKEILDYLGVTMWDEAGYTGEGVPVMSFERVSDEKLFPNVIALDGYGNDDHFHGDNVMEQMIRITPKATYYTCTKIGATLDTSAPKYLDYVLKLNIPICTTSKLSRTEPLKQARQDWMKKCIDNGTTFFIGAGNSGDIYAEAKSDLYFAIGAASYNDGQIGKEFSSSVGEELDFMMIDNINGETGTSYATNKLAALMARVQHFFMLNAGRYLYRSELESFIHDNCVDMKEKGFDTKTGYGLFRLPKPESIDVNKYLKMEVKKVGVQTISEAGINLIKKWEGCKLEAYKDAVGVWTIGYGTTSADYAITKLQVKEGVKITQLEADEILLKSINVKYSPKVARYNSIYNWNQNQFDALVSFAYNIGSIDQLTANGTRNIETISQKILAYNTAGGKVLTGLTNRRKDEKALFDTPYNEGAENMNKLVLTIGSRDYIINGERKKMSVAPIIIDGRTLVPIRILEEVGNIVEWNGEERTVTVTN